MSDNPRQTTVREFLRNFNAFFPLPDTGVIVKGRDKEFIVLPLNAHKKAMSDKKESLSDKMSDIGESPDFSEPKGDTKPLEGFCDGIFEYKVKQPVKWMERDDENGTLLWTKKLCAKCIKLEEDKIKASGGVMREKLLATQ